MANSLRGLLAVGVLALLGGSASAQLPRFGYSLPGYTFAWGFSPSVSYSPYLNLPRVPGFYQFQGYTLSGVGGLYGPSSVNYGYYRNGSFGYGGGGYDPELAATFGSGYRSSYSKVADYQRSAIDQAQRNAKWDTGATSTTPDFDRWLKDAAARRDATPAKEVKEVAIDPALVNPPDEAIVSGEVLNKIATRIRELEKQGKKATPGLLAPDLTTKIVFAGGAAADAANQFRDTELRFPAALKETGFTELRAELEKSYAAVVKDVQAGKKANQADVDRLLKAIRKAHESTRQLVADAPFGEACDMCDFFAKLESATKYLKDEKSVGAAGADWSAVGATVAEVVRHEAKYGLRFGPAKGGDEAAYFALHRGLLAYCVGLAQAK